MKHREENLILISHNLANYMADFAAVILQSEKPLCH